VLAIPIYDGRKLKGVIEIATIYTYTERDIEFLKSAVHNIGIAISTAQNRKRLQELLEETQAQSEELQAQHNELENVNAELEVQAEKLQASEEELKVQQEELKQANEELEERSRLLEERNQVITERNVEIQMKADQLAQTTKYKSEFLANMSHELRTPLNSILLLSRLMYENQDKNLTAEQIEYARVIQSSGNGLLSLIDEILDLSKIESGKMELEYQRVSIKDVVDGMRALFNPMAKEKEIEFRSSIASDVPDAIETDKLRLDQIIKNLISNAIKFTSKGFVSLHIYMDHPDSNFIRINVKDTGIGIPKEKHAQVFEAFRQADGSTRRKYGGTGLGLSISRELVKLLGGDITLKSEADQGSEFILSIPVSKDVRRKVIAVGEDKKEEAELLPLPELPKIDRKYISTYIPESVPDDRRQILEGDKVMLIVEDDVNFAKSLLDYTRKRGYKGIVAVRGDEGIELAKQFLPTGILLDIQLPIKSGWEVMEELKSSPQTRHIPVHIMSSYEVKNESLSKGAVNFINKPIAFDQMPEIFQKIEYVLTHHPKKVLIVEENAKHAKALAYFLETYNVNLEITSQLNGAIDLLRNDQVDCVILDMGIPDQKSYDVLESLKKTPGLEHIPIIIFTGKSLSHAEEVKIKQYADSIVIKTAHSYKRMLDEVSLFLHLMERDTVADPDSRRHHKLGALQDVLKNKTVLVADDDMRNIFSLTKALEKYNMNVIAAVDGKDALQKLQENPKVDIVLMDMMMPQMDGYESTTAIRKIPKYRHLPIIAVTAKAMMGDRAKCINAGASDYITKPVDVDQLFSLLRVWLYERA
jgi:signal transduction histidine kinase/DNA-binding response OmpR family regulator